MLKVIHSTTKLMFSLICLLGFGALSAQVLPADWRDLQVVEVEVADTVTAGCEIPINVTIENVGTELVNTTSYALNYYIDEDEPEVFLSFLEEEFSISINAVVLEPGETLTIQQNLSAKECGNCLGRWSGRR